MKIRFWGVRSGIVAASEDCMELGGNTGCLEVHSKSRQSILLNCGTGLISYAKEGLDSNSEKSYHLFLTNFAWDIIQGFPFFFPIHNSSVNINIYSPFSAEEMEKNFTLLFDESFSPMRDMTNLNANIKFTQMGAGGLSLGELKISFQEVSHSTHAYAYKVEDGSQSLVYVPKHEIHEDEVNAALLKFINGTDLLIHNGHFFEQIYRKFKVNWGYSSIEGAMENAQAGNCGALLVTSHHPAVSDDEIRLYVNRLKKENPLFRDAKLPMGLAAENHWYDLEDF